MEGKDLQLERLPNIGEAVNNLAHLVHEMETRLVVARDEHGYQAVDDDIVNVARKKTEQLQKAYLATVQKNNGYSNPGEKR